MRDRTPSPSQFDSPGGRPPVRHGSGLTAWSVIQGILVIAVLAFILKAFIGNPAAPADQALTEAVESRNIEAARSALATGANVNYTNGIGAIPLHTAAWKGDVAMATLLLDRGANIDAMDSHSGETPLHSAARGNQPAMVALLLGRGANRFIKTRADSEQCNGRIYPAGVTALDIAHLSGFTQTAGLLAE